MKKTNEFAASGVFEYTILGKAIKNSDVTEILIYACNPRQRDARMFLCGADMDVMETVRYDGWVAFVSHTILKRFQKEFTTTEERSS